MTRRRKKAVTTRTNKDFRAERTYRLRRQRHEFGFLLAAGLVVVAVFALSVGIVVERHRGAPQAASGSPGIDGPFTLVDGSGKRVTDRDFRGRFMLVYFGYTSCPDVCPTTLNEVAAAMLKLGPKAARVQPLFISVDPKRDTPKVVQRYTAAFDPRIIGLTGTPEQIAVAATEYRVYHAAHRTGDGPDDCTVDHSSILYLMGPDGRLIAPVRPDESGAEMAAAISEHLP